MMTDISTVEKKALRIHEEELLDTNEDEVNKGNIFTKKSNDELDTIDDEVVDKELDNRENKVKKTKVDESSDDEVDLSNGEEDDESSKIEESPKKNS